MLRLAIWMDCLRRLVMQSPELRLVRPLPKLLLLLNRLQPDLLRLVPWHLRRPLLPRLSLLLRPPPLSLLLLLLLFLKSLHRLRMTAPPSPLLRLPVAPATTSARPMRQ